MVSSLRLLLTSEPDACERIEKEHRRLLAGAGFSEVDALRQRALRDLIVARKT